MNIFPNAYYNYRKHRKASYSVKVQQTLDSINDIYHRYNGVPGYRQMKVYLERKGITLSALTVHKYMNKFLSLRSIVKRRKPGYVKAEAHKVFKNLIEGIC